MASRITPETVRARMGGWDQPLLVCAYEDEEECARYPIAGAITLQAFVLRAKELSRDQEVVFYCA